THMDTATAFLGKALRGLEIEAKEPAPCWIGLRRRNVSDYTEGNTASTGTVTWKDEPAFPEARFENDPAGIGQGILHYPGVTKRELFAAMAMQGLVGIGPIKSKNSIALINPKEMAITAIEYADALIAELEKEKE